MFIDKPPATVDLSAFKILYDKVMPMDAIKATDIGVRRGRDYTAYACNEGRVEDSVKLEAGCDCVLGADDIFCHGCMAHAIWEAEANGRQLSDFVNTANAFNRSEHKEGHPERDPTVLWDAFEEGIRLGVDECLEKMVPADRLMTMAVRGARLEKARDAAVDEEQTPG